MSATVKNQPLLNNGIAINLKTLVFNDKGIEQEFIEDLNKKNLSCVRLGGLLGILLFGAYAILDYYTYPSSYQQLWAIRSVSILIFILGFTYSFHESYIKHMQAIFFWFSLVIGGLFIALFQFPGENSYKEIFYNAYILIEISIFTLSGLKYIFALISILILNSFIFYFIIHEFSSVLIFHYVLIILSTFLITAISAYFMELTRRKNFLLNKQSKKLLLKIEKTSQTDYLTQLPNRRAFINIIDNTARFRQKKSQVYFSFMMIDIDYFKQYNDTYGHCEGDKALVAVANTLNTCLKRSSDFVFRLGGEEFGVLTSNRNRYYHRVLANTLCQSVEKLELKHKRNQASNYLTI